jgi:hypothetical protein
MSTLEQHKERLGEFEYKEKEGYYNEFNRWESFLEWLDFDEKANNIVNK